VEVQQHGGGRIDVTHRLTELRWHQVSRDRPVEREHSESDAADHQGKGEDCLDPVVERPGTELKAPRWAGPAQLRLQNGPVPDGRIYARPLTGRQLECLYRRGPVSGSCMHAGRPMTARDQSDPLSRNRNRAGSAHPAR
jgi:hypothetical protein